MPRGACINCVWINARCCKRLNKIVHILTSAFHVPNLIQSRKYIYIYIGGHRRAEFTTVKGVGVFCGTWNVNAKRPDCPDPVSSSLQVG